VVSDACILDDYVAISTHTEMQYHIHTFRLDMASLTITRHRTIRVDGDVTCLSIGAGHNILAGVWKDGRAFLGKSPLQSAADGVAIDVLEMVDIHRGKNKFPELRCGEGTRFTGSRSYLTRLSCGAW